jgi:hypothetical protein
MNILIPLVSILCSGVVSAIVAQVLINSRSEKDFRRRKLEELFLSIDKYCVALSTGYSAWPKVAKGELTYDQGLDFILSLDKQEFGGVFEKSQMIIALYFPELTADFQKVMEV